MKFFMKLLIFFALTFALMGLAELLFEEFYKLRGKRYIRSWALQKK